MMGFGMVGATALLVGYLVLVVFATTQASFSWPHAFGTGAICTLLGVVITNGRHIFVEGQPDFKRLAERARMPST